jgi:hypothetical protein
MTRDQWEMAGAKRVRQTLQYLVSSRGFSTSHHILVLRPQRGLAEQLTRPGLFVDAAQGDRQYVKDVRCDE